MAETTTLEPSRFSTFELAYLLAGRTDAHAARTRELLGIPTVESPDDVVYQAGQSGLITRGLLGESDTGVVPRNEAGVVALTIGTGVHWVSLAVRTADVVDLSLLVQGESASFLVRSAPGATFDFTLIKPGETVAGAAKLVGTRLLDQHEDIALMVRTANIEADNAVLLLRSAKHGWQIGESPVFPGDAEWPAPDLEATDSTREGVLEALAAVIDELKPAS